MTSRLAGLASRGGVVNIVFGTVMQALAAVQSVIIGRLLGPEVMGIYALATGGVVIGTTLKNFGISQKLVQERETDLFTAYGVAFTLEIILAGGAFVLVGGVVGPVLAVAYHRPVLVPVVAALSLSVFTTAFLYLPAALPYREMNFVRRNLILSVGPAVTFAVTVPAAVKGLGIWSLVAGDLTGFTTAAVVMFTVGSVRPHIVLDRSLMRRFVRFGGPLWGASLLSTVSGWISTVVVSGLLGVPALGYFTLSQSWASQATQVDGFLSDTLYPALCSIQSSVARQRRAFTVACRLSMGWAAPVGAGMIVFASPVVHTLLGNRWAPAIFLMRAEGAGVMINSIAYSWNRFYSARGDNRPTLVASALAAFWLLAVFVPLTVVFGLHGVAGAIVLLTIGTYLLRRHYLSRIFDDLRLISMVWREWLAAAVGAAAVLGCRATGWSSMGAGNLFAQAVLFGVLALGMFALLERELLGDVVKAVRSAGALSTREALDGQGTVRSTVGSLDPSSEAESPASPPGPSARWSLPAGRPMSFPLSVSADPDRRTVWVTTRDWPALGRIDLETRSVEWTELPPFPHVPSPDGEGGCWTALTRGSALAHVDKHGRIRTVQLPKTRELLVTAVTNSAVWAVDATESRLWRVDRVDLSLVSVQLRTLRRPDFVCWDRRGGLWVADTHSPALAVVEESTMEVRNMDGPHPTRGLIPDWSGRGMWLGSSVSPQLTLVGWDGEVRSSAVLPGVPFGLTRIARGVILATLKDRDSAVVVRPARREVVEIPLGDSSQPMGCAVSGEVAVVALAGSSETVILPVPAEMRSVRPRRPVLVS